MCSFFRWANTEFHIESPMKNVPALRFQKVEIEPSTGIDLALSPGSSFTSFAISAGYS
jgi:hypothetical protein